MARTPGAHMIARRGVFAGLAHLRGGKLEIAEGERTFAFGPPEAQLRARMEIRDPRAYAWALRGSTGLGEGYVDGLWTSRDLVELSRIACRNLAPLDSLRRLFQPLLGTVQRVAGLVPANTRSGARRNISAHYDLGNRLFESFLDKRLMYSSAVFNDPSETLEQAQLNKLERICAALELGPDDHLLEIGTGWGGLAIHAAETRGCRVTTTTISREQHAYAAERIGERGLDDRIELLLTDYRDLDGAYDKLVSIEMIEAVGWQYFAEFFRKCSELTRPAGAMFLQAIVIDDDLYEQEKAARTFANKHIFPGGCLPSLELISRLGAANGMPVVRSEEISDSYALTLNAWRERFNDAWHSLRPHGYDERFSRLWNFYLGFSEGGFRERRIRDLQIVLAKAGSTARRDSWRLPTAEPAAASL
jgi:cyclopropane-fatty-acyl-phospholipid synthase